MRKVLYFVLVILLLLFGALAIGPHFINWNQYKPLIQEKAQAYLGRTLKIEGDIKLVILPSPGLSIYDLRLSNAPGAAVPDMIKLREVSASVAFLPLLKKEVIINRLEFIKPEIDLEKFPDGSSNWDFLSKLSEQEKIVDYGDKAQKKEEISGQLSISLKGIEITHAQLTYRAGGAVTQIKGFNTQMQVLSLQGPFTATGSLIYEKLPLSFKVKAGGLQDLGALKMQADIEQGLHKASFEGELNLDKMQIHGYIHSLVDGKVLIPFESPLSHPITLESELAADNRHISLRGLTVTLSDVKARGSADLSFEGSQGYHLQLKGFPGKTSLQAKGAVAHMNPFQGFFSIAGENIRPLLAWAKVDAESLPPSLHGKFSIQANLSASSGQIQLSGLALEFAESRVSGKAAWKGKTLAIDLQTPHAKPWLLLAGVKNTHDVGALAVKADMEGDAARLKFSSLLKVSGGALDLKGILSRVTDDLGYNLDFGLVHPNFNTLLAAFDSDIRNVILGAVKIGGHVEGTLHEINLTNFKGNLSPRGDAVSIAGNALIDLNRKKPKIKAVLTLGHIGLDNFLPAGKGGSAASAAQRGNPIPPSIQRWSREAIDFSGLQAADISLKIHAASLKYKVYHIQPFALEADLSGGALIIPTMAGGIFCGRFTGSTFLTIHNTPSLKVTMALKNANLQSLLGHSSNLNIKGGKVDMDLNIATQGKSSYDLVSQMKGHMALLVQNGVFEGFDLHAIAKNLRNAGSIEGLAGLFGSAMSSGKTPFERFSVTFNIKNGVAQTNDLTLISTAATANGKGFIDLPKWFMDISADIKLVNFPELPPFKFFLRGPLDDPQHEIDKRSLGAEFFKKFGGKAVNKILKKATGLFIPGLDGEGQKNQEQNPERRDHPQSPVTPEKVIKNVIEGLFK